MDMIALSRSFAAFPQETTDLLEQVVKLKRLAESGNLEVREAVLLNLQLIGESAQNMIDNPDARIPPAEFVQKVKESVGLIEAYATGGIEASEAYARSIGLR